MQQLNVILEGDNCWPDLKDKMPDVIHLGNGSPPIQLALLDMGTKSGRPSVAIRIDLPDGKVVIAETTARLLCIATQAIIAKHPGLFET